MLSTVEATGRHLCRAAFAALALSLGAGCSLPAKSTPAVALAPAPPPPAPDLPAAPPPPPPPDATAPVLAYADRIRSLQGAELVQEIVRSGDPQTPADQLRLAMALSQTRQLHDLVRAQDFLQRVLANGGEQARPLHPLARLLAARLAEQRRVEDLLDRQNQQVKDLQRRLEQTQDKLDALKEIERSLSSRPAAAPAPARRVPAP